MKCFVMKREGSFTPGYSTYNQCKTYGHRKYRYQIIVSFGTSCKLDGDNFLIDHNLIDDTIQDLVLAGSCEQMHEKIYVAVRRLLTRKRLIVTGVKCTIKPVLSVSDSMGPDSTELTHIFTRSPVYLTLLNQTT